MKSLAFLALAIALPASGAIIQDTSFPTSDRQSLRINVTVKPVFPQTLVAQGVTEGQTRILINVDHRGVLTDQLVVAYTNKAFANATLDVLERWKFEPMLLRGEPTPCQVELRVRFAATGVVVSLDSSNTINRLLDRPDEFVYEPCALRDLDRIPTPVLAPAPAFPQTLLDGGVYGSVVVEFYIDELGTVRMPAVMAADHVELGFLAIEAVRDWRFEAPTRNGRPVLAKIRQAFNFRRDSGSQLTQAAPHLPWRSR